MKKVSSNPDKLKHYLLAILLLIVALNAFAGGYYGMAGAKDVPLQWLSGSPFSDYFLPSLILFVVVGGSCLFATVAVLKRRLYARRAAIIAACIILGWISTQVWIIGYVSWMQPTIAVIGVVILILSMSYSRRSVE